MKKKLVSVLLAAAAVLTLALPAFAWTDAQMEAARQLNSLGLFNGTGTLEDGSPDFALDRAPTRAEAVAMLVRLLGKEEEAQSGTAENPFTDVPPWAVPYVAWAHEAGYAMGTGGSLFAPDTLVSPSQYLTLVLRALGYEDGKDFQWDSAWTLSDTLGITGGEYRADTPFTRGDVAVISLSALSQVPKGGTQTLQELIQSSQPAEPPAPETPADPAPSVPETPAEPAPSVPETPADPAPSTPVEPPAPDPVPENPVSGMVWIPQTGTKYHSRANCSHMRNPVQVTLEKALSMGYTPCKVCW